MNAQPVLQAKSRGAIEVVLTNRPAALNALSPELTDALNAYFEEMLRREEVRVVILKGNGRSFCAGLDIKARFGDPDETPVLRSLRTQTATGNIYRKMRACPQLIIGLGHGDRGPPAGLLVCDTGSSGGDGGLPGTGVRPTIGDFRQ